MKTPTGYHNTELSETSDLEGELIFNFFMINEREREREHERRMGGSERR